MGNKAPTATPQSVFVFYGHGSNELCIKPGVAVNASSKHQTVAEYTTLPMPPNVIVVGVGIIGEANYPSLQEAFRIVARESPHLLLDPVKFKELIEITLNSKMLEARKNFPELPDPKLFINDGRLSQKTFNFAGNVLSYDEASVTAPENVDKSGLYSLDALGKDTKSIEGRLSGISKGLSSLIPSPEQLKALFYATDDSGKKIAGSEAFYPSQYDLDKLISENGPQTLEQWSTIFNTSPTTLEISRLFDYAIAKPEQLHIFYLPACRSPYESTWRPPTRSLGKAEKLANEYAQRTNARHTQQAMARARLDRRLEVLAEVQRRRRRWGLWVRTPQPGPSGSTASRLFGKKEGGSRKKKHSLKQNKLRLTRKRR